MDLTWPKEMAETEEEALGAERQQQIEERVEKNRLQACSLPTSAQHYHHLNK